MYSINFYLPEIQWYKIYLLDIIYNNYLKQHCFTTLYSREELLLTLTSINPSIQFTMEYSKDQIPFLDILIMRNENGIWMDLYHKPTDTQRCLSFTSGHPNHCKRNISFCLGRRICTNCIKQSWEVKELGKFKNTFIKIPLPSFTNKTWVSESPFNTTKRLMKT